MNSIFSGMIATINGDILIGNPDGIFKSSNEKDFELFLSNEAIKDIANDIFRKKEGESND